LNIQAQRQYFIYLQSEAKQPFIVRLGNSQINSSSYGYLIIPKLVDSTYQIGIVPQIGQSFAYNFEIKLNQRDHGFLIKNMGEKGWSLFDQQSLELLKPVNSKVNKEVDTLNTSKNAQSFSDILSKASNDPTLKEKTATTVAEKKIDSEMPQVKNEKVVENKIEQPVEKKESDATQTNQQSVKVIQDTIVKSNAIPTQNVPPVNNAAIEEGYKKSVIIRKSESSTTQGFGLVFLDQYSNGHADTIQLVIPNAVNVFQNKEQVAPKETKNFIEEKPDTASSKIVGINKEINKTTAPEVTTTTPAIANNNKCVVVASDQDFFSLRKQMASAEGNQQMVDVASNYFKKTCFTVEQIKNLSFLFLDDEGKYRFFDQAYTHVSDLENFKGLQTEIKDEYYLNRFKAMLRK